MNFSAVRGEQHNTPQMSKFWMDLLNTTQLVSKKSSHFPEVKACRLRMAYSKLQNNKVEESKLNKVSFETTKASFLLDKQAKHINLSPKTQKKDLDDLFIFNHTKTRYNRSRNTSVLEGPELIRTIDVAEIKRMKSDRKTQSPELQRNGSNKKSQQFTQYFRKLVLSQRANNDLTKLFSEGKGVDISDRARFQKIERMKLSLLNKKMEDREKSFNCVSTKLNEYKINNRLPILKKIKVQKKSQKEKKQLIQSPKKPVSSFACQPWQSESIFNDLQQH